ncbi:MAG: universal stress protein [Bacteroidetes bacterium]|nr:universal stress protein [Bacteroidota bacterium]
MKIIVPIDFTPVTENALRYAVSVGEQLNASITLLHILNKEKDRPEAEAKLEVLSGKYNHSAKVDFMTFVGNIFEHIGQCAADAQASFIIMGTHGIKGMQHFIGSNAMKVITHSQTPYIVVQHKMFIPIKRMLVPVDFTREAKQMLPLILSLSETFKVEITFMLQQTKDEFLANRIKNNFEYMQSYLKDNGIIHSLADVKYNASSAYKDITKLANRLNIDLIVTTVDPETNMANYVMGVEEQKIIANEYEIPVLCINLKNILSKSGNVFEYTF